MRCYNLAVGICIDIFNRKWKIFYFAVQRSCLLYPDTADDFFPPSITNRLRAMIRCENLVQFFDTHLCNRHLKIWIWSKQKSTLFLMMASQENRGIHHFKTEHHQKYRYYPARTTVHYKRYSLISAVDGHISNSLSKKMKQFIWIRSFRARRTFWQIFQLYHHQHYTDA